MIVTELEIPGVKLIEPKVFGDARGYFLETYEYERYAAQGITCKFVQDNLSRSVQGVLRGLHMQNPYTQAKLVSVMQGAVLDVAVDVRLGSPTFGRAVAVELSEDNHRQLFVPRGCAHGFCVLSPFAVFAYKCDDTYHPETEVGLRFDDPALGIPWPKMEFTLSNKDRAYPTLAEIPRERLPVYTP